MENGFCCSSPRTTGDTFPAGLRVLVVDDDTTWLKILERMLRKCSYEVTTCCLARDALHMLRERKHGFDIVISDVNMPDMDGFKLLEHVGLEMDLPVIMMSVDGETSRVMKGVKHGACDYLLKPVRMKELSVIWQHVFRKKIHEVKDIESHECLGDIQMMRNGSDDFDDDHLLNGDLGAIKKRKDMENKMNDDQDLVDPLALKKARVIWSVDLHQKFVDAVNQIGLDKVGPKKILDLMNVPWLTRENVASHLQKYRLYLCRLQEENERKTCFGGIQQQVFSSGDPPGSSVQNSIAMNQKNDANGNFGYTKSKIPVDHMGPKFLEGDTKGMVSFLPLTEPIKTLTSDFPGHQTASVSSQMDMSLSSKFLDESIKYQSLVSTSPTQRRNEDSTIQFKQQPNQELEPFPLLEDDYSDLLLPGPQHIQVDLQHSASSFDPRTSISERGKSSPIKITPLRTQYRSSHGRSEPPLGCTINSIPCQTDSHIINPKVSEAISNITLGVNHQGVDQNHINKELVQQKIISAGEPAMVFPPGESLQFWSLQGYGPYGYANDIALQNRELLGYYNSELMTELQAGYFNEVGFSCDNICDSIENPYVGRGLFIA